MLSLGRWFRAVLRPGTDEGGAAAIVCALVAIVAFTFAALTVDLGNAVARKGDTQVQVDFAALAGGQALDGTNTRAATDPAVEAAADYMFRNLPADDASSYDPPDDPADLAADLVDADMTNGNVEFSEGATRMKVTGPSTQVNFGFAGIFDLFGNGATSNSVEVMSDATVGLRSPGAVLPFFLPRNCLTGPVALKNNTNGAPGNVNISFDPPSDNGGGIPDIDTVTPELVPFGAVDFEITLEGSKFNSGALQADFFEETSEDRVPANILNAVPATYVPPASAGDKQRATIVVPSAVANRPGYWQVRLQNNVGWSKKFGRVFVDVPSVEPGCGVAATGDFGFLDSPRKDVTQQADAMALNIAEGIDHRLNPFTAALPPDVQDSCNGLGSPPYPGAILDKAPPNDAANCVSIQTGFNSGDALTSGIITGGSTSAGTYKGFLEAETLDGCDRFGGSDEKDRLGVSTNDDVLSCFLPPGVKVGNVTGKTIAAAFEGVVSSSIFDSPRFAVVNVINYPVNPQNGFYPILKQWPVFITDETPNSEKGSSFASSLNGVVLSSSDNKVASLVVVPVHPDALPEVTDASGNTSPWTGSGTRVITLID